jgi:hypothetical protein
MARCPQCNLLLSGYSKNCPRCGRPLRARFGISTLAIVVVLCLILLLAVVRSGGWIRFEANNAAEFKPDQIAEELKKDEAKKQLNRSFGTAFGR